MQAMILQVCLAYRNNEAKVVVVMTQRPKLVMESTFRRIIPDEQRFGTKFVFRQGSALIPDNLRMVAASRAAATMIVSDSSRYSNAHTVVLPQSCDGTHRTEPVSCL